MNCLVSIIVPVYKVEKFIDKCIQSILEQTYLNWELILVDDGSPDNSGRICDQYAQKDKRIAVIHKTNGGLSDARNVALEMIKGRYITFIDSDDYIASSFLEEMVSTMDANEADIVQCDFSRDMRNIGEKTSKNDITIIRDDRIMKEFLRFGLPKVYACGKLFKSELFNSVRFPIGRIDEDNFTTYKIFCKSNVFVNVNKRLYFYRVNQESITQRTFGPAKFGILDCVSDIKSFLEDKGDYSRDIDYYEMRELVQIYNNAISANAENEYSYELNAIKRRVQELSDGLNDMDIKYRWIVFMMNHCKTFYRWLVLMKRR